MLKKKFSFDIELENLFEELNMTIEELELLSEKGNKNKSEQATKLLKMFLEPGNGDLLHFIQNMDSRKDVLIKAMIENAQFENFLDRLKKEVILVVEKDPRELIKPSSLQSNKARTAWFGLMGSYVVTFDDKLLISSELFERFKNAYENTSE